jgi:hypothetical protein
VYSVYDVNKIENNEENKEKKHFVALTDRMSFKSEAEKFYVSCATARVQF